jgi:ribosomal protein S18 acetylase RimI-like enzyme
MQLKLKLLGLLLAVANVAIAQMPLPAGMPSGMQMGGGSKPGLKPFKEVITDKAKTQKGLFTVHKVDDKFFFEIADELIGKEILAVTRYTKTTYGGGFYGGEIANQVTLKFEKGPDNKIFVRTALNIVRSPDSTTPMYRAVKNSSVDPIAAAFDIKAIAKDSITKKGGVVIEVTDFFKGDNQIVSLTPFAKRGLSLSALAPDRSYIETIKSFPINTEVRTVKTFFSSPQIGGFSPIPSSGTTLPAAFEAGAVTLEMNTSFIRLPDNPINRRMFDNRVGYFADNVVTFEENSQKSKDETFAVRWRLEPKEADVQKYLAGELVEPKKQIVYYIDPATPKQWRKYLIDGINDWQKAFEKAGFKNAIVGKEWPEADSTMSLEDARFSVIRYFASDIENAYGPNVHDPRTGEILESHIGWYHNVMALVHDWYMVQCAAVDPAARKMKFDDELMGQLIRFVSSHEVGHTLGLRHNMGSSSKTPVEKLRDKNWVEANGHTASIMDYARFNYVAQPEDNISQIGLFPRIGDYDNWAIEWGYRWLPGNEAADKKWSDDIIVKRLKDNPRIWFGGEGRNLDPRAQTEDLSDNAIKASEYGIKNLKRLVANLPEWTKEDGDHFENLGRMYMQSLGQFNRYANHVAKHIGGVYETFKTVEQQGDIYEITPKETQKAALAFIQAQVLETPTWLLDKNIWNKIQIPTTDPVMGMQANVVNNLLNADRLSRMAIAQSRDAAKAYSLDEYMGDLKKAVFTELTTKKAIDIYRRSLQKVYVDKLIETFNAANGIGQQGGLSIFGFGAAPTISVKRSDAGSFAFGQLQQLQTEARTAAATTADKASKMHLLDIAQRIKRALETN